MPQPAPAAARSAEGDVLNIHQRDMAGEHPGCIEPGRRPKHVLRAFARFWSAYERWLDDPEDDLNLVTLDELYCRYAALEARWRMGIWEE